MHAVLEQLTEGGVSLWLDDLDRSRLSAADDERTLGSLVRNWSIRGVTTNPTIFERAVGSGSAHYVDQLSDLGRQGVDVDEVIRIVTTDDVRAACDVLLPVWEQSAGLDGRVSIEVDPRLAHDTQGTITQARELWSMVDRPNAMIKIPATSHGLAAITQTLANGISVNVTLIFSVDRYREVMQAHREGLEQALSAGVDLTGVQSVASFFVSRVDTAVDAQLDTLENPQARELRGRAAIANARLAWAAYLEHTAGEAWQRVSAAGARPQRPLWASTGVKDPSFDPARYVVELAAPGCVNTLPEATLHAVADVGRYRGDTMTGFADEAADTMRELGALGVDIRAVCEELETAGVNSFIASWEGLRATVAASVGA